MATVSQSLKVVSGGTFSRTTSASGTEFTTAANQYAIVTITNMYILSSAGASFQLVTIGGIVMLRIDSSAGGPSTAVRASGIDVTPLGASINLYVGPSQAFFTNFNGTTLDGRLSGSYVIFQNT